MRDVVCSVTTKIILTMMLLILPLNVIVLIYTYNMQENMIERVEFDSQKRAEFYMQSLTNTMDNARSLLRYFTAEDPDCMRLSENDISDYARESARLTLHYKIKNMASMTDGADGYFYDFRGTGSRVVYANADGKSELNTRIYDFLDQYSAEDNKNGWHLYEWNDRKYLVFLISDQPLLYGAVIRLDNILQEIAQGIEYPLEEIEFSEVPDNRKDKNFVTIQAEAGKINLYFKISKGVIVEKFTIAQRIMIGLSILYLLLIPVLYGTFRRLFIRPLFRVNEAHRQIEDGNGEYRIEKADQYGRIPRSVPVIQPDGRQPSSVED